MGRGFSATKGIKHTAMGKIRWKKSVQVDVQDLRVFPRGLYLDTEVAAVDVIPEEQVARGGRRSSHFKELHQIKELAVDVAADWKTTSRGGQRSQRGVACGLHAAS